ncbi:MAG TPA: hypothetical protein VE954_34070 [Oligoflexus sp.]|uniref:hypothetical protein n=1 Tax=Oligoflexus sp. TaxID=1971216 RepID=UPI002D50FDA0|nr:hypothetical protein [Oligoflexus sp.]HYX38155.1 hypothetical protein [Oligoflexus sp.]
MKNFKRMEMVAGMILLCSTTNPALARNFEVNEDEGLTEGAQTDAYWNGPNILEVMIQDGEQATPPTPVNGTYFTGLVEQQRIQANWLKSEIGLQMFLEGEKLDPRRYQVDWRIVSSPYSFVKATFVETQGMDFGQKIQIETPLNHLNSRVIATMEIEARIFDRDQPEKAPVIVVHSLRELLANGRDGL